MTAALQLLAATITMPATNAPAASIVRKLDASAEQTKHGHPQAEREEPVTRPEQASPEKIGRLGRQPSLSWMRVERAPER